MTPLEPTPELLDAARRMNAREWTLGPNDSYDPGADPNVYALWRHRLCRQHFASPARRQEGSDEDGWRLTAAGYDWLVEHHTERKETT